MSMQKFDATLITNRSDGRTSVTPDIMASDRIPAAVIALVEFYRRGEPINENSLIDITFSAVGEAGMKTTHDVVSLVRWTRSGPGKEFLQTESSDLTVALDELAQQLHV